MLLEILQPAEEVARSLLQQHRLPAFIPSENNQLPVGLIAQLVEDCTGIAEVIGSNPVQ